MAATKSRAEAQAEFDDLLREAGFRGIPELLELMEEKLEPGFLSKAQIYKIRNGHRVLRYTTLNKLSKALSLKGKLLIENDIQRKLGVETEGKPIKNFHFQPASLEYETLKERLERRGVTATNQLRKASFLHHLNNPLIIENTILVAPIAGFSGVSPEQIAIEFEDTPPIFPDYVEEVKRNIPAPMPNNSKVSLVEWIPPISDQGAILTLNLRPSDYWISSVLQQEDIRKRIYEDLKEGNIHLLKMPLQLNCLITVISADQHLILCRRSKHVEYEKGSWSASIGESIDLNRDRDAKGTVNPICSVRRALQEDLGIPDKETLLANISFIAIAIEAHYLFSILIVVVRLPNLGWKSILDLFRYSALDFGEHSELDAVEFIPDRCLPLVFESNYMLDGKEETKASLYSTSRLGILAALFNAHSYGEIAALI